MTDHERSSLSQGATPEYASALLEYLGDRDPLEVLDETESKLRAAVGGLSGEQLRMREAPGKWSVLEVVWHLVDVALVVGLRFRMAVAQSGSAVFGFDQDAWVAELNSSGRDLDDALGAFACMRQINLAFLRSVPKEHFARFVMHEERGRESLDAMHRLDAAHDLYHLHQIERIKAAVGA